MTRRLAAAGLVLLWAASAAAHDTWLQPQAFAVKPGATLRLLLTSGGAFPELDWAPEPARIEAARIRLVGVEAALPRGERGEHALAFTTPVRAGGVAVAWVATKPLTLVLEPKDVDHYLEEVGATEAARLWRERKAPKAWRETYRKLAKTFVQVGGVPDDSWQQPVGLGLELVPDSDPFALRSGAAFSVRLLKKGRPLAGLAVSAEAPGATRRLATTDAEGRARFEIDAAGPWLLAATEIRPRGDDWESDFTTLTLEVRP